MYGWRGVTYGHGAHQAARGLEGRSHGSCGIHVGRKVEWRLIWMGTVRGMDAGASWIGSVKGPVLMLVGLRQMQSRLLLPRVGAPPGQSNHSICKPAERPCLGNGPEPANIPIIIDAVPVNRPAPSLAHEELPIHPPTAIEHPKPFPTQSQHTRQPKCRTAIARPSPSSSSLVCQPPLSRQPPSYDFLPQG